MDLPNDEALGTLMKRMNAKEFRELGLLQEVNRQFLHPLGLALEVIIDDETKEETFGEVWDCRDDPTGIVFSPEVDMTWKAVNVAEMIMSRRAARREKYGWYAQPADGSGT